MTETSSARSVPNARHVHEYALEAGQITTTNFSTTVYATTSVVVGINPDDTANGGVSTLLARGDHRHAAPCAAPGSITPDDAAAEGNSTSFARANHVHGYACATAAALTKTATASEGAASTSARSDHVHATSALPWGIVAYQQLTAGSAAYADNATTDFALADVVVDATRLYKVTLHAQFTNSVTGDWQHQVFANGTQIGQAHTYNTAAGFASQASGSFLWAPSAGTYDLDVRVNDTTAAGGTLTYAAAATNPRQFWIEDVGPR